MGSNVPPALETEPSPFIVNGSLYVDAKAE